MRGGSDDLDGPWLAGYAARSGVTRQTLVENADMSEAVISRIFTGKQKPQIEQVAKIVLGIHGIKVTAAGPVKTGR